MFGTIHTMPRVLAASPLVGALLGLMAGCATPTQSQPPATVSAPAASYVSPSLDIEQPGRTPAAGQSDSDWGPIWDAIPPGFPEPPGGDAVEPERGPASAAFTVPVAALPNPREVAQFYVDRFAAAGYGGARNGPLEDGSYSAWASDGYGCDVVVTAVSRGREGTLATVFYGAGCPFSWPAEG